MIIKILYPNKKLKFTKFKFILLEQRNDINSNSIFFNILKIVKFYILEQD